MPQLPADKIMRLLPLLSSDKDGEVVATARAIGRTLASSGLNWHVLADATRKGLETVLCQPEPRAPRLHPQADPEIAAAFEALDGKAVDPWAAQFIAGTFRQFLARGTLSPKQKAKLLEIARKYGGAA